MWVGATPARGVGWPRPSENARCIAWARRGCFLSVRRQGRSRLKIMSKTPGNERILPMAAAGASPLPRTPTRAGWPGKLSACRLRPRCLLTRPPTPVCVADHGQGLAPGVGVPLHAHTHESVVYVVKGKVKSTVGSEEYILGPGDVCRHLMARNYTSLPIKSEQVCPDH